MNLDFLLSSPEKIAQAIAGFAFVSLLLIEFFLSTKKQLALFERKDTQINLTLGLLTSFTKLLVKGITLAYFYWLGQWKIWTVPTNLWSVLLLALLNDLIFYWYHRISHQSRFFWAMHVAHHSSEILNTSTAIRGNFLHFWYRFVFWSPLALLGFEPLMIVLIDEIGFYYQMYIHTKILKKFPYWIEFIFNTPSHHRVHHASNAEYIDKNYGAVLIIWDRIFGTFEPEVAEPRYGITKHQPKKNNLFNIITHEFVYIWQDLKKSKNLKDVWQAIFGKP
ncbi:MAG: sterol desaturase family protein [Raineya sp.]